MCGDMCGARPGRQGSGVEGGERGGVLVLVSAHQRRQERRHSGRWQSSGQAQQSLGIISDLEAESPVDLHVDQARRDEGRQHAPRRQLIGIGRNVEGHDLALADHQRAVDRGGTGRSQKQTSLKRERWDHRLARCLGS